MWQELGLFCLPLPLLLLFLAYMQLLKRSETRTLISRLRLVGGSDVFPDAKSSHYPNPLRNGQSSRPGLSIVCARASMTTAKGSSISPGQRNKESRK
jgi:hypothetical protein